MVSQIYIDDSAERWRMQRDQFTGRSSFWRYADEVFAHHLLNVHEMYCQEPVCVKNRLPAKPALCVAMDLLGLTPMVQMHVSSDAPSSIRSSREGPTNDLTLQKSDLSGCRTHQDAPLSGTRGLHNIPQISWASSSPDHAYCRNIGEKTTMTVIKKEIIEEPELGLYQTYTVKEEVLGEDWTEQSTGQQEARSIEQSETFVVKEKQVAAGWTEDSEGGDKIVIEPQSSETCLVKDQKEESSGGLTEDTGATELGGTAPVIAMRSNRESKYTYTQESNYTKKQRKFSLHTFREFCIEGGIPFDHVTDINLRMLDQLLGKFYTGVKSTSKKSYSLKSMLALRYGLQKHFLHVRGIDIIKDRQFAKSCYMFKCVLQKLKKERKADIKHHKPVGESDMNKIHDSLDQNTPCGLQNKVFVDICSNFSLGGVEELYNMQPNDFPLILSEQHGLRYFRMAKKHTQTHRDDSNSQGERMFEIPGSIRCPVAALLKYKSKLNYNFPFLWQKPKKAGRDHGPWYDSVRLGVKRLQKMMMTISSEAGCSTIYTNLSLTSRITGKETMVRVIDKEVVQEPELEEPGYQIYTVKEAVLEEDWTEESAGHQEILTEQMSTEQPETCLVKEEVLEEDWTEDDRGQELLTQPTLTEQPETCLVKEEVLEEDWTEDGRGQELLTQPTSTEQPETCLSKGEEMSDEWTEDSEGGHGIVKEPQSGGWTEDLEATGRPLWLQIVPLEESIHKRDLTNSLQEERRRTEEGNSKEVERELSDESDYKMYEVKEEPLESSCTENDDLANLKMLVQAPLLAVKSNSESKNTKRQLKHSRQVFQEFCKAGDIEFDQLSDVNLETLDQLLGKFYTGVKSSSDKSYSAKSMQALRYGLQKHFLHLRDIDIIRDRQFAKSRSVFNALIQKLKKERKADVEPVSESDMNKIQDSLDQNTPCGLQSKVFVDICSNFAFRGVEEVYDMRPNDFLLSEQNGLRYFYMAKKPTQINQEDSNSQRGRMFEIPGSNRCPVAALLKYKSKLNYNLPFFWQKPKKAGRDHGPWYDNVRMGVKRLPMMMKMISSEAGCSTIYTNHSLTYMYNSKFKWY